MWNVNQNQDANNQNANFGWNVNNPDAGGENPLFISFLIAEIVNIWLLIFFTFTSQATITMPEEIWVGVWVHLQLLHIQACQCLSRHLHLNMMTVNLVSMKLSSRRTLERSALLTTSLNG